MPEQFEWETNGGCDDERIRWEAMCGRFRQGRERKTGDLRY